MYKSLVAASMLSLAPLTPAFAESVRIPYDKTSLSNPADTEALYQKIEATAKTLCVEDFNETRWMIDKTRALNECVADTVNDAIRLSREPTLKAYHQSLRTAQEAGPVSATLAMR